MSSVQVYKEQQIIPTYELLQDDLNPLFDKRLDPYPYTLQNFRSLKKTDKPYEVVILENEYIKLTIIPSLGGRLYSAIDKRTNQEFLYKNNCIKPRMVGNRGAWFSGGIEFNFPISHSPTTMDRVNYTMHTYGDGSASVIFGNIEQISYMNWKVELRLYPGKAYIEENVKLHNPTSFEHRFYFWTNTAVEYNESLKLIYPFDWCTNNVEQDYVKWPFYKDIDCRYANQMPLAFETFGKLLKENFFGIYNFQKDYGLVHYADRKMVKGAKFFTWGTDPNGHAWNQALTDDESKYIEIQSGPFESQMVYKFLNPQQSVTWSEYWYPIFGMNGFKYAEKEIAVNFETVDDGIECSFLANEWLKNCHLILHINGKMYQETLDLSPELVHTKRFQLDAPPDVDHFTMDLYCGTRHLICIDARDEFSLDYPDTDVFEDSRVLMIQDENCSLLKQAQIKESLGFVEEAIAYYQKNLSHYPNCVTTLNRLGNIYLKHLQLAEAEDCFKRVLTYDNRNSQARFYLALTEKEKGNWKLARRILMDLSADTDYFIPSVIELVKIDIAFGYYKEASSHLQLVKHENHYVHVLQSIVYRKDGQSSYAKEVLNNTFHSDEFLLTERYLLGRTEQEKHALLSFTEGDERVLLPLVLEYLCMDLTEDAEELLQLIKNPSLKCTILSLYIQQNSSEAINQLFISTLKDSSLDFVFINERKLVSILLHFKDIDHTGTIDYLLGTYFYSIDRKDEALDYYLSSYNKGLRYTVLLHNIGYAYYEFKKDLDSAQKFYEQDVLENNGMNEDSLVKLDQIYKEEGKLENRIKLLPYMERVRNKSLVLLTYIDILKESGQTSKALQLFEHEEFENWEGQELSGPYYRDFIIHLAKQELAKGNTIAAKQWIDKVDHYPVNLHYGESTRTAVSENYYFKGIIYAKIGDQKKSLTYFKKGYEELQKDYIVITDKSRDYSLRCLKELQTRELLNESQNESSLQV